MIEIQIMPFQVISKNKSQRKHGKDFSFQQLHLMKNMLKSLKFVTSNSAEIKIDNTSCCTAAEVKLASKVKSDT